MKTVLYVFTLATLAFCVIEKPTVFADDKTTSSIQKAMNQTLFVAGTNLKLGIDKKQVLDSINKIYKLHEDDKNDLWTITEGEGDSIRPIGYVQFNKDKLNNAMKDWGSFSSEDGYNFGQAILSTVMQMKDEWKHSVNMQAHTIRQPGTTYNTIYIYYGKKQIHMGLTERIVQGTSLRSMSVQEYLWND